MSLVLRCFAIIVMTLPVTANAEDRTLFSFQDQKSTGSWRSVNDGVMGGRSTGRYRVNSDANLEFSGTLSLENNGGFASVRAGGSGLSLKADDVIIARVKGDGREYRFNVYTQRNLGGYSYRQSFQTRKDEWMEIELPLDQFVATWRGRVFRNQKLDPEKISGVGILLGDKKPGPFRLEIEWIKAGASREK